MFAGDNFVRQRETENDVQKETADYEIIINILDSWLGSVVIYRCTVVAAIVTIVTIDDPIRTF